MKMSCGMRTPLSRSEIVKVKTRALRRGVWYRAINKMERACIDLVIEVVNRVRSRLLSRMLYSVLEKLDAALESPVQRLVREVGYKLASRLSLVAQSWGNRSAACWVQDDGFVRYLAVIHMNEPL